MAETTTILRTDVLGRVKTSKDHREALLDAFEKGGASGKAFARDHGVNYQTWSVPLKNWTGNKLDLEPHFRHLIGKGGTP